MNHSSPSYFFQFILLFVCSLLVPVQALATAGASIHPADANDRLDTFAEPDGYILINPNLDPIVSTEGYSHTTSVEVDQSAGLIRGYAGYNLDAPATITRTENLISTVQGTNEERLVANVAGHIIYDAILNGPATPSDAFATVTLQVDGSFNYLFGAPSMSLLGAVSLNRIPNGDVLSGLNYVLGGQFNNIDDQNVVPDANSVFTREDVLVYDAFGNLVDQTTLPNFTPDVQFISLDPDALSLQLSLTVPLQTGDRWVLGESAAGSASHAFQEDFRNIAVGETGDVDAASGYVDFLNTAVLSIELPEGFSFEGADAPPLSIISHPAAVPLPASVWLLLSGVGGLLAIGRRR